MYRIDILSMWRNKKKNDAKNKSNNNWLYVLSAVISAPHSLSLTFTARTPEYNVNCVDVCVRVCVKCKTSTIQPFEIANKIDAYTKFDDTVSMRNVLLI